MKRRTLLKLGLAFSSSLAFAHPPAFARDEPYRSPYRVKYRHPEAAISAGFDQFPWNSPGEEGVVARAAWYDEPTRKRWGPWGPPARQYPAFDGLRGKDASFLQDRVILAASRWIGHSYQHHHIPDWNPPAGWPWKKVSLGHNSPGVDCSNFSSFYYNYALGIKLDTGIVQQAERLQVRGPGGAGVLDLERLKPKGYDEVVATLQPADLLYIRNKTGKLAHVVMWLGEMGDSSQSTPLVLDSTGEAHRDANGVMIPSGIQIRPFGPKSWYFRDFAHAHRIIPSLARVHAGQSPEPAEGGADIP